jgi:putative tributyrin esterase
MSVFDVQFLSEALGIQTSMTVTIPQEEHPVPGRLWPTLYLLHGLSDNHSAWHRWTSVERYAEARGLAVVMATTARGFYVDAQNGYRYGEFFSRELPGFCRAHLPLSPRREENFVAGLSMGGYGAFSLGLSHPDQYAAAGSFSGALHIAAEGKRPDFDPSSSFARELSLIFGDLEKAPGGPHDLLAQLSRAAASGARIPRLYQCCGTEDFLYEANVRFRDHARSLKVDLTYEEGPGVHEWGYWDAAIQRFLAWLPLPPRA